MTTKTEQKETFLLEFGGFYESIHSDNVENQIESWGYDWEKVDYRKTCIDYSKNLLDYLNFELDFNLEFIDLISPKEYNFTTDKIECSISEKEFKKLKKEYINNKTFIDWLDNDSKSYDGFVSFYSGAKEVIKENEILLQYIFRYINLENDDLDLDFEFDIELIKN
tara:strand:- start:754 stop:1251 length:498 start_codon:yes stop_codon:yes gene_type:complete